MSLKEIIGKLTAMAVVSIALIVSAVLVFVGPHPYNDYFFLPQLNATVFLALVLLLLGLGAGGLGLVWLAAIIMDARMRHREEEIHVAPRQGPPDLPPAWGMGDVGRPEAARAGDEARPGGGGGGARVMSVAVSNIDGPILIGVLLVWTAVALIFLAPR